MGNDYEQTMSKKQTHCQHNQIKHKLIILFLIIATNLLTIYIFTSPRTNFQQTHLSTQYLPDHIDLVLKLNATRDELINQLTQLVGAIDRSNPHPKTPTYDDLLDDSNQITFLRNQISSSHSLIEELINQLTRLTTAIDQSNSNPKTLTYDDLLDDVSDETKIAIGPHKLPLGFRKLRWNTRMKVDRGVEKNEWYFSALLEKPMT